jgi:hypothetical protein
MHYFTMPRRLRPLPIVALLCFSILAACNCANAQALAPLVKQGESVKWWFVFKFNATAFPGCFADATPTCIFGGKVQDYPRSSQKFVYATEKNPALREADKGCLGDSVDDPVGATFDQVFNGEFFYVVWNDQFYLDPKLQCARGNSCSAPWAHSKGMLAWDKNGAGFIMQVSTPNWPGAGQADPPRAHGNTLGCLTQTKASKIIPQNNIMYSQHFFAVQLNKEDLIGVLKALKNAAVVTDPENPQIVRNGGPPEIASLVEALGETSGDKKFTKTQLSTPGVTLISKPANLHVPPWQMISAVLGGQSLRVASWWNRNRIPTTTSATAIECWDEALLGKTSKLGLVEIAESGQWKKTEIGLKGGQNHAKIGVSKSDNAPLSIFGDMNQEGALEGKCQLSQNGRGGLFFVVENETLSKNIKLLLRGDTAGTSLDDDDTGSDDN